MALEASLPTTHHKRPTAVTIGRFSFHPVIALQPVIAPRRHREERSDPLQPQHGHMDCHGPPRRKLLAAKGRALQ
jgi:hypothetical protein